MNQVASYMWKGKESYERSRVKMDESSDESHVNMNHFKNNVIYDDHVKNHM